MAPLEPRYQLAPCPPDQAEALAAELGLARPMAEALYRRGLTDAAAARAFLELDGPLHDPLLLGDMPAACTLIGDAVAAGRKVCVHGDYDADGICATALAVLVLRELGADVSWHLPSRFDEGYGLAAETVERLAGDGISLLITVDCGITAVEQVARARELGMDVIVTDHHRPGPELPDCLRVCAQPSDYPFPELCGTGVVFKLAQALWAAAGRDPVAARAAPRPGGAGHRGRRGAAGGREPRPGAGRPAPAGAHGQARPAGADGERPRQPRRRVGRRSGLPAGAPHQRRRPAVPPGRGAGAAADRRRASGRTSWPGGWRA